MPVKVTKTNHIPDLESRVKRLAQSDVLVGIPAANSSRLGDTINNAELLYIFSKGSPLNGIPPRPVLEPAIADPDNRALIVEQMKPAAQAVFSGDQAALTQSLGLAGQEAANVSQDWFTNPKNGWAQNSTRPLGNWLAWKLSEKSGKKVSPEESYTDYKRGKGDDPVLPGIDTGAMRAAITFVVEEK